MPDLSDKPKSAAEAVSVLASEVEAPVPAKRNLREAITTLASDFVGIGVEGIDAAITRSLELVGRYAGADLCAVYLLKPDGSAYERSHVWISPDSGAYVASTLPAGEFAWLEGAQQQGVFYCADTMELGDLPAASWETIEASRTRSFVTVVIDGGKGVRGFVAFASERPSNWGQVEEVALLEVAALIMSNALARKPNEQELSRLSEFERLIRFVATTLSTGDYKKIDREIEAALHEIAEFLGCNRAGVYLLKPDRRHVRCTHEWAGAGAMPLKARTQNLPLGDDSIITRALFDGNVFAFENLDELPDHVATDIEYFRRVGTISRVQLPLLSGADLVGGLTFASTVSSKVWSDREVGLLQVAAEVIANALQRAGADLERNRHVEVQRLVASFATEFINASADRIDLAIEQALARLGGLVGACRLGLYLLDEGGRIGRLRASWARDEPTTTGLFDEIPSAKGTLIADGLAHERGYSLMNIDRVREMNSDFASALEDMDIVSAATVSIGSASGPIGWLGIAYDEPQTEWSEETAGLFQIAAQAFANVLQRVRSEAELARLAQLERTLGRVAANLVSLDAESVDAVIVRTLESIGEFLGCNRGGLFAMTPDAYALVCSHEWVGEGGDSIAHPHEQIPIDDFPFFARFLRGGKIVITSTIDDLPATASAEREMYRRLGIVSRVQVPLKRENRVVGAMMFLSTRETRSWSEREVLLLQVAADLLIDASRRADAEVRRHRREDLQALITNLATEFINVPHYRIDSAVDTALRKIATFADAVEVGLYEIDDAKPVGRWRTGWLRPDARPGIELFPAVPVQEGTLLFAALSDPRGYTYMRTEDLAGPLPEVAAGLAAAGIATTVNVTMSAPGGPIGWLSVGFSESVNEWPTDIARLFRIAAQAFANVTIRRRVEVRRRKQHEFERLIGELATDFINVSAEEVEEGVSIALAEIGKFSGVDRLAIFVFDDSDPVFAFPYKDWASPRGERPIFPTPPLPFDTTPAVMERFFDSKKPVDVLVADILDDDAVMGEWLTERGIRRFVDFPMVVEDKIVGFLAAASLSERDPLHGTPQELFTLAAEMFANAVERRRLQRAADDHRQALAHALRLGTMSELATGLAHELNQPLAAMASYTGACMRRIEAGTIDGPELTDLLGRVSSEALRAGEIIRRLRAHVGKGRPRRSKHRVEDIVESVLSLLGGPARDHDVRILTMFEENLPRVSVDATEIEQVLINLVQNAIESIAGHAGPRREISIHANRADPGMVAITVSDTGAGIVPEAIDTLFDQFSSTKAKGLGLGLAICRLIVVSHGGTITGGLGGDGGAVFNVTLPVAMDT